MLQLNPDLSDLLADAETAFLARSQRAAEIRAAAPGRVNLIGEHIDYCDGFVMPFAISRYIVMVGRANASSEARIWTSKDSLPALIDLASPQRIAEPTWSNYIRGVIAGFQQRGHTVPGFDAMLVSSIPSGAGLSSSAALEAATATFLEALVDTVLDTREKALLCQKAEHDFAKVPCGIMDQFASAFGKINRLVFIDCQSGEIELIPFENPDLTVLIANTMVSHQLADGGYAKRRQDTEIALEIIGKSSWREVLMEDVTAAWSRLGDPVNRRARHVVSEIFRTQAAAKAAVCGDFEELGSLMAASHASLRDDFEVSCSELDAMVSIAAGIGRANGVIGSRMTGGGFGGSTVTLCESSKAADIADRMAAEYQAVTGIATEIFASRPARGAHQIKKSS